MYHNHTTQSYRIHARVSRSNHLLRSGGILPVETYEDSQACFHALTIFQNPVKQQQNGLKQNRTIDVML